MVKSFNQPYNVVETGASKEKIRGYMDANMHNVLYQAYRVNLRDVHLVSYNTNFYPYAIN